MGMHPFDSFSSKDVPTISAKEPVLSEAEGMAVRSGFMYVNTFAKLGRRRGVNPTQNPDFSEKVVN